MQSSPIRRVSHESDARFPPSSPAASLPPLTSYFAAGEAQGIIWTDLRRSVLELLWRDGGPRGPYDLAEELSGAGRRVYPNSLYRVLDSFEAAGLIVTIVSSRRVRISPDPTQREWAALHCTECERLELVPYEREARAIRQAASHLDFSASRVVVECSGRCRHCRQAATKRRVFPVRHAGGRLAVALEAAE